MKITEAIREVGRPLQFYPALARVFGIEEAIFMGQMLYWKGKEEEERGIRKTSFEIERETSLTEKQQRRVKKKLKEIGCIEYEYDRLKHVTYYKVFEERIDEIYQEHLTKEHLPKGQEAPYQRSGGTLPKVSSSIHRVHREYTESTVNLDKELELLFGTFWLEYPLKKAKIRAKQIWLKIKDVKLAEKIIEDVKIRKLKERQWLEGYIPHPTTYLNGARWEDDITPVRNNNIKSYNKGNNVPDKKYDDDKSIKFNN